VARTRLRQEDDKYKRFFQTLALVYKEEGGSAIYRGLGMQLMRQIPNTAIMMGTYELIVFLLSSPNDAKSTD
jgi:AGAP009333-PA (fragment)